MKDKSLNVLSLIIAVRTAVLLALSYAAAFLLPYAGNFAYRDDMRKALLPPFISSFANFDGIHYIKIAMKGYEQYNEVFFPLYPLFVRALTSPFGLDQMHISILSAVLISNISFLIGLYFLYKLVPLIDKNYSPFWTITAILSFPTAFYFNAAYTESLFFALTTSSLYFLRTKRILPALILAALSSATRLVGIFLFIPFVLALYKPGSIRTVWKGLSYAVFPFAGLAGYMTYLQYATGNPLAFFTSQASTGLARSTELILLPQVYFRYAKILLLTKPSFPYFISLLEVTIFTLFFLATSWGAVRAYRSKNTFAFGIALFSLCVISLSTLTGTFLSTPRFALLCLTPFLLVGHIKSTALKTGIFVASIILQAVLFVYFVQGYFVS